MEELSSLYRDFPELVPAFNPSTYAWKSEGMSKPLIHVASLLAYVQSASARLRAALEPEAMSAIARPLDISKWFSSDPVKSVDSWLHSTHAHSADTEGATDKQAQQHHRHSE